MLMIYLINGISVDEWEGNENKRAIYSVNDDIWNFTYISDEVYYDETKAKYYKIVDNILTEI